MEVLKLKRLQFREVTRYPVRMHNINNTRKDYMNLAIDTRIQELAGTGQKAKAITEALKAEGVKTLRGKVPSYSYVQNRIQALRMKKGASKRNASKAQYTQASTPVNTTYQNLATFVTNIVNNGEWAAEKKVNVLKAWFAE